LHPDTAFVLITVVPESGQAVRNKRRVRSEPNWPGSGAHPGGGVTGAPGHNAAREILRDFRRKRIARVH